MTTPVLYGEHERATPGASCLLCCESPLKPVADHCHVHGWVRGTICPRCNSLMAFIDRRISVRVTAPLTLDALVAHAGRCPDCQPFGVEDLEPSRPIGPEVNNGKVSAFMRVPVSLKTWLATYARDRGLTLNAAAIILLDQELSKAEKSAGT